MIGLTAAQFSALPEAEQCTRLEIARRELGDAGAQCSKTGLIPERETEVRVIQGGCRGPEENARIEEGKIAHGRTRSYASAVRSAPGGNRTANRLSESAGGAASQRP